MLKELKSVLVCAAGLAVSVAALGIAGRVAGLDVKEGMALVAEVAALLAFFEASKANHEVEKLAEAIRGGRHREPAENVSSSSEKGR